MDVYAPGVIKLLGEHAVVYGKLSVAAAVGMKVRAKVEKAAGSEFDTVEIALPDLGLVQEFTTGMLDAIYRDYKSKDITSFVAGMSSIDKRMLPYAVIAGRLMSEGVTVRGLHIEISSDIPVQKGYASSAACATALTVALVRNAAATLPDDKIIDIARDGDRIAHLNPNAGAIDVSTSYYGGVVSFSKATGARPEAVDKLPEIVLINTGPKLSTAVTVGRVSEHYKNERDWTEKILNEMDRCAITGLTALKGGYFDSLGALMYEDQGYLRQLGVSSDGLDTAVETGKKAGASGVKLSGGGGGGIAIAIGPNPNQIIDAMKKAGFEARLTEISKDGAKSFYGAQQK